MFYSYAHTVEDSDIVTAPHELDLHLTEGIIHQVDVLFQSGCEHHIQVQIFDGALQLWPSNRGATLKGDATVISFREFYPLVPGRNKLTAKVWTDDTDYLKEIIINIGLLPKRVIQPLSFEELLAAAAGIK